MSILEENNQILIFHKIWSNILHLSEKQIVVVYCRLSATTFCLLVKVCLYIWVFCMSCMASHAPCECSAGGDQKRASDLALE